MSKSAFNSWKKHRKLTREKKHRNKHFNLYIELWNRSKFQKCVENCHRNKKFKPIFHYFILSYHDLIVDSIPKIYIKSFSDKIQIHSHYYILPMHNVLLIFLQHGNESFVIVCDWSESKKKVKTFWKQKCLINVKTPLDLFRLSYPK